MKAELLFGAYDGEVVGPRDFRRLDLPHVPPHHEPDELYRASANRLTDRVTSNGHLAAPLAWTDAAVHPPGFESYPCPPCRCGCRD